MHPVARPLETLRNARTQRAIEVAITIPGGAGELRDGEGDRFLAFPSNRQQSPDPPLHYAARYDAVERSVDGHARAEAGKRPDLCLRGAAPHHGVHQHLAHLCACLGRESLTAPHRLPHLPPLLRPRSRTLRSVPSQEHRQDALMERLLLARAEAPADALPEGPPFGSTLDSARMPQVAVEHAPEPIDTQVVAVGSEARSQEEPGE